MSLKSVRSSLVPFALLFVLVGCEKEGPLERAGEEIDDAVDEVKDAADDVRKDLE